MADVKKADVLFIIDATGSMASSIAGAHRKASDLAVELRNTNPDVDFRFGCICYRDPVDSPSDVHQVHDLNDDVESLIGFLSTIQATGGGDGPEDWVGAYEIALKHIHWRSGAKTIVHIADAPAHGSAFGGPGHEGEAEKLPPLIRGLAEQGIVMSGLDLNRGATKSFTACKSIYDKANGPRFDIETFVPVRPQRIQQQKRNQTLCRHPRSTSFGVAAQSLGEDESMQIGRQWHIQAAFACQQALDHRY
jgi:hypothetical protein